MLMDGAFGQPELGTDHAMGSPEASHPLLSIHNRLKIFNLVQFEDSSYIRTETAAYDGS